MGPAGSAGQVFCLEDSYTRNAKEAQMLRLYFTDIEHKGIPKKVTYNKVARQHKDDKQTEVTQIE